MLETGNSNKIMMQNIDLVDETYDINTINTYCLSIRVSLDGLSFCIADKQQQKIVAFKHYQNNNVADTEDLAELVSRMLHDEKSLPKYPIKTTILYVTPNYTLVPESIFIKEKAKLLLSTTHQLEDLDEIHYLKLEKLQAWLIYAFPSTLANKLTALFPSAQLVPQVYPFLQRLDEEKHNESIFVGIHVNEMFFDLAIYKQNDLQLINSYSYKAPSDVVFYLTTALTTLGHQEVSILFSCATEEEMEIIPALKKFYPNTINDPFSGNYTLCYKIQDHLKARFSNLFYSATCE